MLHGLLEAANRGVRVRLLLDDNGIADLDSTLAAINVHPNIQVRIFNPLLIRSPRLLGYLVDTSRVNRRMHNKSFTADNLVTIIGGRNIGDAYFGANSGTLFADLDVLAAGPVAHEVSADFDRYWTSASAYPIERLEPGATEAALADLHRTLSGGRHSGEAQTYTEALSQTGLIQELLGGELALEWAPVRMVSDDPGKVLGKASGEDLLSRQLTEALGTPESSVTLVSPYFIPTEAGVTLFRDLTARGVEVRILTNALEATDVAAVHAGYAKYRKALLKSGVMLYELRRQNPDKKKPELGSAPFGSSSSSLHAKTFAVDGETLFVGSFNFDPRSTHLNTELGFVIGSAALAQQVDQAFDEQIPLRAYQVRLDTDGDLYWVAKNADGSKTIYATEPNTGFLRRSLVFFLSLLPIEPLL